MVNRVVKLLVLSDFVLFFASGLLAPIFAVFILKTISGSSLQVIGLATTFYWIARTSTTVPLSRFLDRTDGERDEFYAMVIGSFLIASIPLFLLLVEKPWHLYLVQFISGLSATLAVPAWRILFTDHIDVGRTGFEWSLEDVGVGVAMATSAYLGSILADRFGFTVVLVTLSILGYIGATILIPIYKEAKTLSQMKREKILQKLLEKRHHPAPPIKVDHKK